MNGVAFDTNMNAFAIQGGATLGDIYETLYRGYGVVLPGGHCPHVSRPEALADALVRIDNL